MTGETHRGEGTSISYSPNYREKTLLVYQEFYAVFYAAELFHLESFSAAEGEQRRARERHGQDRSPTRKQGLS